MHVRRSEIIAINSCSYRSEWSFFIVWRRVVPGWTLALPQRSSGGGASVLRTGALLLSPCAQDARHLLETRFHLSLGETGERGSRHVFLIDHFLQAFSFPTNQFLSFLRELKFCRSFECNFFQDIIIVPFNNQF